ncbi:MAG TPA: acVLRF1 family peptidyl-tRNA hydrolase [Mycobacteriales bacterium]|jgi:hypothetical protein|nr:acVLRF1 family peptidyl-tRNA hydrolase [Mycobacteriales bacterium]
MAASRPAAGGGRWVEVAPERLERWLAGFAERHGTVPGDDPARLLGADGEVAEVEVPYPPLVGDLVEHCLRPRRLGLLLVRLGGHAMGIAEGERLVLSKVGSRQVHGRSAAGGWSQQRFARRREGQVRVALGAATQSAVDVLLPHAASLEGLVTGGERTAVTAVLEDRRLGPLAALPRGRFLDVPDPRLAVLQTVPALARSVRIRVLPAP